MMNSKMYKIFIVLFLCISCNKNDDSVIPIETEENIGVLNLMAPSYNQYPTSSKPEFQWESFSDDEFLSYSLFLGKSEESMTEIASDINQLEYKLGGEKTLDLKTNYYWQVKALSNGNSVAESDIFTFTTESISPTLIMEDAPYGKRKATAIEVFKDKIWLIGGVDESDNTLSDIWSTTNGENWILEGNLPFDGIFGHELIYFNNKLWIYGGVVDGFQSRKIFSSGDGINWVEELETTPFIQYNISKFIVLKEKILRIAGYSGDIDDVSPERHVYSSDDGLNWNLETENHGFKSKYGFQIETVDDILYGIEANPDPDIKEIVTKTSINGIEWSINSTSPIYEHGNTDIRTIKVNDKIVLMIIPENGNSNEATFYELNTDNDWQLATAQSSTPIRIRHYTLINLNDNIFAIGGIQPNYFSIANNDVWRIN